MKKFRFRLEKVLRVKEIREKVKMKEVATIDNKIQTLNGQLQTKNNLYDDMAERISNQRQGSANSVDLKRFLAYREILKKESNAIENRIELAMHEINQKREELSIIYREKKVIQKLREIKLEQFNKELLITEQQQVDELSQTRSRSVFPPTMQ